MSFATKIILISQLNLVSGEVPEQGVISKRSGLLFEKRLIEKHLEVTKSCPVSGNEMQLDDLIEIKCIYLIKKLKK